MDEKFEALQNNLGYHFKDISLLRTVLTHSSYANEKGAGTVCNELARLLQPAVKVDCGEHRSSRRGISTGITTSPRAS